MSIPQMPPLFPQLALPSDIAECGLAVATGPSFDDYRLDDLPEDAPNLFGCGKIYNWRWPKNYIATDFTTFQQFAIPFGLPSGLTVWSHGGILDKLTKLPSAHRPTYIKEIPDLDKTAGTFATANITAYVASCMFPKTYVLGMDAGHSWDWVPHRRAHGLAFTEPWDDIGIENAISLTLSTLSPFLLMEGAGAWVGKRLVNLSTTSVMVNYLENSEECRAQPWGRFDRYTRLMVVFVGNYHPHRSGVTVEHAVRFIHGFQQQCAAASSPRTPIGLVCKPDLYREVISRLEDKEVLFLRRAVTPFVKSQFTHVVGIGDYEMKAMKY